MWNRHIHRWFTSVSYVFHMHFHKGFTCVSHVLHTSISVRERTSLTSHPGVPDLFNIQSSSISRSGPPGTTKLTTNFQILYTLVSTTTCSTWQWIILLHRFSCFNFDKKSSSVEKNNKSVQTDKQDHGQHLRTRTKQMELGKPSWRSEPPESDRVWTQPGFNLVWLDH